MKYKIQVFLIEPPDERGYSKDREIYRQDVEALNLLAVIEIEAVNKPQETP